MRLLTHRFVLQALILFVACTIVINLPYFNVLFRRSSHQLFGTESTIDNDAEKSSSSMYGYVVAMQYSGQQGTGIQALMSLQCWIGSFNLPMLILEPILNETQFISFSNVFKTSLIQFSDLFDISRFNSASASMKFAQLGSQDHFYKNAPRKVIYVNSRRSRRFEGAKPPILIWSASKENDCYSEVYIQNGFCVVRVIDLTSQWSMQISYQIFSAAEMREIIFGHWSPQEITLIFKEWHTPWYVVNPTLQQPSQCRNIRNISTESQFYPSHRLLTDVQYYENYFLGSRNKLAVMLRLERMTIQLKIKKHRSDNTSDAEKCLSEAVEAAEQIWSKDIEYSKPIVAMDVGKYGSRSWYKSVDVMKLKQQANSTLSLLFHNQWTFEQWENSFTQATRGITNSGYIAALQRTLASRADCLVLLGGGYFQDLALNDYLRNHPKKEQQCVHLVCAMYWNRFKEKLDG